jgi:uncharacterized YigZ family protein
MDDNYRTLARAHRAEPPKTKGSRFIASGFPFAGEERLTAEIARLRDEFPDANHHCWAWRDGERFRYADDGEPSGSAGQPILRQIDGAGLDRVALIVTRIFGGTKLGVGGLIRAYGGAAKELLGRAEIVEVVPYRVISVTAPYESSGALAAIAVSFGIEPAESSFGEQVRQVFHIPRVRAEEFVTAMTDRTAGRAEIQVRDPDS